MIWKNFHPIGFCVIKGFLSSRFGSVDLFYDLDSIIHGFSGCAFLAVEELAYV